MRRPLLLVLFGVMIGHVIWIVPWPCYLVFLPLALLLHSGQVKRSIGLLFLLGVLMGFSLTYGHIRQMHLDKLSENVTVEGTLLRTNVLEEKRAWLKLDKPFGVIQNGDLICINAKRIKLPMNSGVSVKVTGKMSLADFQRNPYTFDEGLWLATKGVAYNLYATQLEELNPKSVKLTAQIEQLRFRLLKQMTNRLMTETAFQMGPIATGMLLGEDDWIDPKVLEAFKISGIMHLLSVSGAHFAILLYWIKVVTDGLKLNYWLKKTLTWTTVSLFVWLIGASIAAVRALLMFLALDGLKIVGRQQDGLNAFCLSGGLILLVNPFLFWDIGLQLSSLAILALILIKPIFERLLLPYRKTGLLSQSMYYGRKVHGQLWSHWFYYKVEPFIIELLSGIAVSLLMFPILVYYFNQVSFIGVILSPFIAVVAGLAIPISCIQALMPFHSLNLLLGLLSGFLYQLIQAVSFYVAKTAQGLLTTSVNHQALIGMLVMCLCLIGFKQNQIFSEWFKRSKVNEASILIITVALSICACGLCDLPQMPHGLELIAFDVGQGDSTLILGPKNEVILVDTGLEKGVKQVKDSLLKLGVNKIDALVLTHPHADHIGGALEILNAINVKQLYLYEGHYSDSEEKAYERIKAEALSKHCRVTYIASGFEYDFKSGLKMRTLWPPKGFDDANANNESLVNLFSYHQTGAVLTGDIGSEVECGIINKVPKGRYVLKASHHGSRYSNHLEWLCQDKWQLAYIQSAVGNRYGHPSPEALKNYQHAQIPVLRNDQLGAVHLYFNQNQLSRWQDQYHNARGLWRLHVIQ